MIYVRVVYKEKISGAIGVVVVSGSTEFKAGVNFMDYFQVPAEDIIESKVIAKEAE